MTTSNVPPAVRLEGITKRFGDVVANDDVDFTLEKGRFTPSWARMDRGRPP